MGHSVSHLIHTGEHRGLPVKLLREIYLKKYAVRLRKEGGGRTFHAERVIEFPEKIVDILGQTSVDGITKEAQSIGLLYHEGTHAFINLKLDEQDLHFKKTHNIAKNYYKGGTFDDGSSIPDQELDSAVTESAAWYVHIQILTWWVMKEIMQEISIRPPKKYRKNKHHTHIKSDISSLTMQDLQTVKNLIKRGFFGYSKAYDGTLKKIDMPICPELKIYCDQVIMEGKIDNYNVRGLVGFLQI